MRAALLALLVALVAAAAAAAAAAPVVQLQDNAAAPVLAPQAKPADAAGLEQKLRDAVVPKATSADEAARLRLVAACAKIRASIRPGHTEHAVAHVRKLAAAGDWTPGYEAYMHCLLPSKISYGALDKRWPTEARLDGDAESMCDTLSLVMDAFSAGRVASTDLGVHQVQKPGAMDVFETELARVAGLKTHRDLPEEVRLINQRLRWACSRDPKRDPRGLRIPGSDLSVTVSIDKDLPLSYGHKGNRLVLVMPTCNQGVPSGTRRLYLGSGRPGEVFEGTTSVARGHYNTLNGIDCTLSMHNYELYCVDGRLQKCDLHLDVRKARHGKPHMIVDDRDPSGEHTVCPFEWVDQTKPGDAGVHYHLRTRTDVKVDNSGC